MGTDKGWMSQEHVIEEKVTDRRGADEGIRPLPFHTDLEQGGEPDASFPDTEGALGRNAGLVLLHPFLLYFFKELDLLEGEDFKNESDRGIGVHLLHYLATGREQVPDFECLFEKYLCGMRPEQATHRYIKLTSR